MIDCIKESSIRKVNWNYTSSFQSIIPHSEQSASSIIRSWKQSDANFHWSIVLILSHI